MRIETKGVLELKYRLLTHLGMLHTSHSGAGYSRTCASQLMLVLTTLITRLRVVRTRQAENRSFDRKREKGDALKDTRPLPRA
jgi:hypothetical protein